MKGNSSKITFALFILTIALFRKRKRKYWEEEEFEEDVSNNSVSKRGVAAMAQGSSYWESFMCCLENPCDPQTNPEGYIALCTAENKLIQEILASRLMHQSTAITAFSDSSSYCYGSFLGLPSAREAAAYFLQKRFLMRPQHTGMHRVDSMTVPLTSLSRCESGCRFSHDASFINPEHIALGAGVNSLISQMLYILAQPGDVVLIPAPFYATFEYDARTIAGCVIYPVYMNDPIVGPTKTDLDHVASVVENHGKRVRVLLLTNPNDPLGVIYKPSVMRDAVKWARARNIHTIVDEIYALSVHKPQHLGGQFQSIIQVLENHLDNDVHFLWGLSKDFGATGFRFAIVYTQNTALLRTLANLNIFAGVPNPMQMIVSDILLDDMFVDAFLDQSRNQLLSSYYICTQKLEEMVIPFVPAEAGLFVYVDFSSLLPDQTFEGEMKFALLIQKVARIVMTPGRSQKDCKPGMFRLCYAWVSPQVLTIAMERLSYLILQIRRNRSWDDLVAGNWKNEVTKCGTHLSSRRSTAKLSNLLR